MVFKQKLIEFAWQAKCMQSGKYLHAIEHAQQCGKCKAGG